MKDKSNWMDCLNSYNNLLTTFVYKLEQENERLKQQLAEKDKFIKQLDYWKSKWYNSYDYLRTKTAEKNKQLTQVKRELKKLKGSE